jgi:hypothetical protein
MITAALSYTHVQFWKENHWFMLSVSWLGLLREERLRRTLENKGTIFMNIRN